MDDYQVNIGGEIADDDGFSADLGTLPNGVAWWEVPLPPCPDCGGAMAWAEAGHVPGTRECRGCGSLFSVRVKDGRVIVVRERFH